MKKVLCIAAALAALSLSMSPAYAKPSYGGDIVTEYTKITGVPAIIEETIRLRFDDNITDNFYVHARAKAHAINNKAYDSIDRSVFDQAYAGYKNGGLDIRAGKQPLYLGHGLLADLNVSGVQASLTSGSYKLLSFYSTNVKAADATVTIGESSLGATFKKQGDATWGVHFDTPVGKSVSLGAEYVENTDNKQHGYIVALTSGHYSLSYRNIQNGAINAEWATNYHYADSKGFRIRADYKIGMRSILTFYQDIARNNAGIKDQNITYIGYATYY